MKIAIIGLPNCGKTTTFNALTAGDAETAGYSSGRLQPNLATVKVPDPRLQPLTDLYQPRKVTPAEVQYIDVGGFGGGDQGGELPAELLNYIGGADALLHVVRCFADSDVPHPRDSVDPARDLADLNLELTLSDLAIVERRLERLAREIAKLPTAQKPARRKEEALLQKVQSRLEAEQPILGMQLSDDEAKQLRGFAFLTAKPQLVIANLGESELDSVPSFDTPAPVVGFCAQMEAELVQLQPEEAAEFMEELGIEEAARDRVLRESYRLLGLISFLTVGEDEVRAWTLRRGLTAEEAGGVIHTDIQRGFIRAEVVTFEHLIAAGSMAEARRQGHLRVEGRSYEVADGDVCHFLFNV